MDLLILDFAVRQVSALRWPDAQTLFFKARTRATRFAHWAMVCFEQFFENYKSSPPFSATFFLGYGYALVSTKKWVGLHFGRFFSKTHLVTLSRTAET
jgi:hypothetical protein